MKSKKYILVVTVLVLVALTIFSVNSVFAGRSPSFPPPNEHAPVCYKLNSFAPGIQELQCYDVGKDIIDVQVKTSLKYDLQWDSESVTLRVFPDRKNEITFWTIKDKAGAEVSGNLP